jgi:hypothetical protein
MGKLKSLYSIKHEPFDVQAFLIGRQEGLQIANPEGKEQVGIDATLCRFTIFRKM